MSTMIERVAKAIWDSTEVADWNTADEIIRPMVLRAARAAIEAMRVSTFQMKVAGRDALEETGIDDASLDDATSAYIAMIDVAISSGAA